MRFVLVRRCCALDPSGIWSARARGIFLSRPVVTIGVGIPFAPPPVPTGRRGFLRFVVLGRCLLFIDLCWGDPLAVPSARPQKRPFASAVAASHLRGPVTESLGDPQAILRPTLRGPSGRLQGSDCAALSQLVILFSALLRHSVFKFLFSAFL